MNIIDDLQTDLALAAECDACVLLTAEPGLALEVARKLADLNGNGRHGVDVLDCHAMDPTAVCAALERLAAGPANSHSVVLVREVHVLGLKQQLQLSDVIDLRQGARRPRLVSSSSVSLFDRVRRGLFDERLFYQLNTIHITVHGTDSELHEGQKRQEGRERQEGH